MSIQFPLYTPSTTNSGDVYYNEDTLLLHADGVTGSNNTGTFVDASTNTFVITRTGTPAQGSVNPFGTNWSAYFDGGSTSTVYASTVTTSLFAFGSNNFTIEAWINSANTVSNYPLIIGNYVTTFTTNGWGLYYNRIDTGNFYFSANNGGMTLASGSAYVIPGWNHVAVVRNGATVSLFVNGTQTATYNYAATSLDGGAAARLYIGDAGGNDATTRFNGYISNLRVVNGSAVYTGTFTPSVVPLSTVTNTVLLTLASNYVRDLSTLNFATTASSGVSIQRFNPFGNTQTYSISSATIQGSTYFDGSTGYLTLGGQSQFAFGTNPFTIELWVYITVYSATSGVIWDSRTLGSGAPAGYLGINFSPSGNLRMFNAGTLLITSSSTVPLNSWAHISISRDSGNNNRMFINGQQVGSTVDSTSWSNGTNRPTIGTDGNGPLSAGYIFNGYMSNLRVVNGTAVYTGTFTVSTVQLTTITNTVLLTSQYSNSLADLSTASNVISATGVAVPSLRTPFARVDTSTAATVYGGSIYLNGSSYLTVPYSSDINLSTGAPNWTVELWIYPTSLAASASLLLKDYVFGSTFPIYGGFLNTNGTITWYASNGVANQFVTTSIAVSANTWNHLAFVRNGATATIYVNGVSGGSFTISTAMTDNGGPLYIGAYSTPGGYFPGYFSNIRIVKGQALYTGTFTVTTVALTTSSQGATGTVLLIPGINAGIYDSTMENNLVTVGAAQINTTATTVKFGSGSVKFNGSTDYLTIPANTAFNFGTGNFTIEAWIYTTSSATQRIISYATGSSLPYEFLLVNSGSNVYLDFYDGTTDNSSGSNYVTQNAWVHVAVTRSGTTVYLFINGVVVGTYTGNSKNLTSTGALYIGTYKPSPTNYFSGYIDDLRITSGIARYTATFTPPTASFTDIQLVVSSAITAFTTATNIGTVTWGYNTATTRWGGIQEPTSPTNLTPASIEDQINTSTGYFSLPQGTTGQRPANPQAGYIRYNTTLDSVEYYNFVTGWTTIP